MHPKLLVWHGFQFHSYGVMLVAGLLAALAVADREAVRRGWPRRRVLRMSLWSGLAAVAAGRIAHGGSGGWFHDLRVGYASYGAAAAGALALTVFARVYRLRITQVADVFALAALPALALARVGCAAAGCCYGAACTLPWAIRLQSHPQLGPVHPVQVYEALAVLAGFGALWVWRRRQRVDGEAAALAVGGYGILRFALGFLRGDGGTGFWPEAALALGGGMLLLVLRVRAARGGS